MFLPRHVDKKGAVQPVAPQQLLWLWMLWVQLWWVLLLLLRLQLLWLPGPDCRRLSSGLHHRYTVTVKKNLGALAKNKKKTVCWTMQRFALNASLEGVCCLPPDTLRGSIGDRVFL